MVEHGAPTIIGWAGHALVTFLVNRLVFFGGWTVTVWLGDRVAAKRTVVRKERYRSEQEALDVLERYRTTIASEGIG